MQNAFNDVVALTGLLFAIFYILTALATIAYYRRRILTSAYDALVLGVLPSAAAGFLVWIVARNLQTAPAPQIWSLTAILGRRADPHAGRPVRACAHRSSRPSGKATTPASDPARPQPRPGVIRALRTAWGRSEAYADLMAAAPPSAIRRATHRPAGRALRQPARSAWSRPVSGTAAPGTWPCASSPPSSSR